MNMFYTVKDSEQISTQSGHMNTDTAAHLYQNKAEDILTDDDLLELYRIVRTILRKKPDTDRISKLLFCFCYALGESVKFSKSINDNRILFADCSEQPNTTLHIVHVPGSSMSSEIVHTPPPSLPNGTDSINGDITQTENDCQLSQNWLSPVFDDSSSSPSNLNASTYFSNTPLQQPSQTEADPEIFNFSSTGNTADAFQLGPYDNFQSGYPISITAAQCPTREMGEIGGIRHNSDSALFYGSHERKQNTEVLLEPKQRGFYYQDNRILREPTLLQRFAEQGVLTQASLLRKRKRNVPDLQYPTEVSSSLSAPKKPKIPHRHGEFNRRRDDIISRMRSITLSDLEQKAQRLPADFTLSIETVPIPSEIDESLTTEEAADFLEPALRVLTMHSNMKPHLANGMNQNGIYYNTDYFRLWLAFEQFQKAFAILFPNEVSKDHEVDALEYSGTNTVLERDRDRERNANMKAYRGWIEPLLTETNWAAFRRNIVVGERMKQLTTIVGQGVLLMTKELSGSKLHLTFTNNEWDVFIHGLVTGKWDSTIKWDSEPSVSPECSTEDSLLVYKLRQKFATYHWFRPDGTLLPSESRKRSLRIQHQNNIVARGCKLSKDDDSTEKEQPMPQDKSILTC